MKITGPKFIPRLSQSPVSQSPVMGDNPPVTGHISPVIGDQPPAPPALAPVIGDPPHPGPGTAPPWPEGLGDTITHKPVELPPYVREPLPPPIHELPPGAQRFHGTIPIYDGDHLPPGDPDGVTLTYCSVCNAPCAIVHGTVSHCHNAPLLDTFLQPLNLAKRRVMEFNLSCRHRKSPYKHVTYSKRDRKFQVQLKIDKKAYHLGLFVEDHLAAKVADNAIYYLTKKKLITRELEMNFPDHYSAPPVPPEYPTTQNLERKILRHRAARVSKGLPAVATVGPYVRKLQGENSI